MSFGDYWYKKQRTNIDLCRAEKVTLTIESFRKELEKAFLAGKIEGAGKDEDFDFCKAFEEYLGGKR